MPCLILGRSQQPLGGSASGVWDLQRACSLPCYRKLDGTTQVQQRPPSPIVEELWGIDLEELRTWLPPNSPEEDLSGWAGSSEEERRGARDLAGFFQSTQEVDKFVDALRSTTALSRTIRPKARVKHESYPNTRPCPTASRSLSRLSPHFPDQPRGCVVIR